MVARPGDALAVADRTVWVEVSQLGRPADDLADYSRRRAEEWGEFHAGPEPAISQEEIAAYFECEACERSI